MNREHLKKNFEDRGYRVVFFDTADEATEFMLNEVHDTTVGFGGSATTRAMDLHVKMAATNKCYRHENGFSPREVYDGAARAKVYVLSANAVAETGEMVNIDGRGNRLSASLFGPDRIFYIVGRNKIVPDLHAAIERAYNVAAPLNAKRYGSPTPCLKTGKCFECRKKPNTATLCRATVIYDRAMPDMEATIVFIDQDMGF